MDDYFMFGFLFGTHISTNAIPGPPEHKNHTKPLESLPIVNPDGVFEMCGNNMYVQTP